MKRLRSTNLILLSFMAFLFQACTHSEQKELGDIEFCIPDALMDKISVDTVKIVPEKNELLLSGKITSNEDKVVKVYPLVGGNVEDLKVELGDYVEKGQILAVIRSSEVADFENQLISAESNLSVAQKNVDVAEDMFKTGLSSEKDVIYARKELQKAESELKRIREVLKIYGVKNGSFYTMKAPISGFVIEKNVTENMQFRNDNTNNFFTISDINEIWVLANVFESEITKIKVGYDVSIKTLSYPDKDFNGKIDKIFNVLDPNTRTMKVRIKINNPSYELKPEMFAKVTVRYTSGNSSLGIPSKSIIFDRNKYFVMIFNNKCNIVTKEVKVSGNNSGTAYINEGLKEGDKVISKSQLLIYEAINNQ